MSPSDVFINTLHQVGVGRRHELEQQAQQLRLGAQHHGLQTLLGQLLLELERVGRDGTHPLHVTPPPRPYATAAHGSLVRAVRVAHDVDALVHSGRGGADLGLVVVGSCDGGQLQRQHT